MAKYITNINLNNGNEKDYNRLEEELGKESFKSETYNGRLKSQIGGKGIFFREGSCTLQEVINDVRKAATRTGKNYSFFVLKDKSFSNLNL